MGVGFAFPPVAASRFAFPSCRPRRPGRAKNAQGGEGSTKGEGGRGRERGRGRGRGRRGGRGKHAHSYIMERLTIAFCSASLSPSASVDPLDDVAMIRPHVTTPNSQSALLRSPPWIPHVEKEKKKTFVACCMYFVPCAFFSASTPPLPPPSSLLPPPSHDPGACACAFRSLATPSSVSEISVRTDASSPWASFEALP